MTLEDLARNVGATVVVTDPASPYYRCVGLLADIVDDRVPGPDDNAAIRGYVEIDGEPADEFTPDQLDPV